MIITWKQTQFWYRKSMSISRFWDQIGKCGPVSPEEAGLSSKACIRYPPTHPPLVPPAPGLRHCSGLQLCRQSSEATATGQTRGGGEKECAGEHKHWPVGGLAGPSICFQLGMRSGRCLSGSVKVDPALVKQKDDLCEKILEGYFFLFRFFEKNCDCLNMDCFTSEPELHPSVPVAHGSVSNANPYWIYSHDMGVTRFYCDDWLNIDIHYMVQIARSR